MEKDFNEQEKYQKDTTATGETTQAAFVDANLQEEYLAHLRKDQNLGMAVVAGAGASLVGAVLWAVVTVMTGWQIGFMAIGVGILVGFAVRFFGKGVDIPFGIVGAVFSLLGCVFGNFLSIYGFAADAYNVGYFEVFGLVETNLVIDQFVANMGFMDLFFYGFALYEGFKFSTISPTDEDLLEYAAQK
jgi:hypothetical protein